jgi:serine protease Do
VQKLDLFKKALKIVLLAVIITGSIIEAPFVHHRFIRNIAEESTVQIYGQEGSGSGSHIQLEDGRVVILTNKHVCKLTGPLMVVAPNSAFPIARKIISISEDHDLCAIEALPNHKGISIGSEPTIGDELYTLGHPRGEALNVSKGEYFDNKMISIGEPLGKDGQCSEGSMKTIESFFGLLSFCSIPRNAIEVSSPTYPGNSGSPVVNKYGNLVAVIFAGDSSVENMGFAVPLSYVKEFLSLL